MLWPLLSFRLSPLMIVEVPTFIIVFALKLQLACCYSIGSSVLTRSREQRETTSSGGNVIRKHINLRWNINIWICLFLLFFFFNLIFMRDIWFSFWSLVKDYQLQWMYKLILVALFGLLDHSMAKLFPWTRLRQISFKGSQQTLCPAIKTSH